MEVEHDCPVCGAKNVFEEYNSMEYCPVCNWGNDAVQNEEPDYSGGENRMSLNQAKKAFAAGNPIY